MIIMVVAVVVVNDITLTVEGNSLRCLLQFISVFNGRSRCTDSDWRVLSSTAIIITYVCFPEAQTTRVLISEH